MTNIGPVYDSIMRALRQIQAHLKKNGDLSLLGGTFFFKAYEKKLPVLIFASQLRTERPNLILNSNTTVALILQDTVMESHDTQLQTSNIAVQ